MDLGENQAMETTIGKIRYSFEKAVHTKPLKTFSHSRHIGCKFGLFTISDEQIIGRTGVTLLIARYGESNLGNFVADSMVDWVRYTIIHLQTIWKVIRM